MKLTTKLFSTFCFLAIISLFAGCTGGSGGGTPVTFGVGGNGNAIIAPGGQTVTVGAVAGGGLAQVYVADQINGGDQIIAAPSNWKLPNTSPNYIVTPFAIDAGGVHFMATTQTASPYTFTYGAISVTITVM